MLTYTQLADAIHSAVARCEKAGLRFGWIVGLIVADPVWHICLIAALYRLGVVSVSLAPEEISVFADGVLSAVLHDSDTSVPANGMVVEPNWFTQRGSRGGAAKSRSTADELCRIALSSGTTGQPGNRSRSVQQIALAPADRLSFRGRFALMRPHLLRSATALAIRLRHQRFRRWPMAR